MDIKDVTVAITWTVSCSSFEIAMVKRFNQMGNQDLEKEPHEREG